MTLPIRNKHTTTRRRSTQTPFDPTTLILLAIVILAAGIAAALVIASLQINNALNSTCPVSAAAPNSISLHH